MDVSRRALPDLLLVETNGALGSRLSADTPAAPCRDVWSIRRHSI
jgi:hypothetical protein